MSRPKRRNNNKNSRNGRKTRRNPSFWSDGAYTPSPAERISPTPDPAALLRSLGEPPLSQDTAAELHLAAVYEEAVQAATALAAANGLLQEAQEP